MATAAVAVSLVLGGCGGSGTNPPPPAPGPEPAPIDVTMSLTLPAGVMAAAFDLADAGMSDSFTVAAGTTETRGGVNFTCTSDHDCTVTLTNSAGTLRAHYMTQKDMAADMATVTAAAVPVPPPEPMPAGVSGAVALTAEQRAALLDVLPDNGDTAELMVGADGVTRAGVTFTCDSDYPCTVTVSNSAGRILATWESRKDPDGMVDVMAMGHEPPHATDPLAELNAGSASAIANIIDVPIDAPAVATPGPEAPRGTHAGAYNALDGLVHGSGGALNIGSVTLTSNLDPNADDYDTSNDPATGGSTLMAMNEDAPDATVALEGWSHKVLFQDWGDTADADDGGYETGALIYAGVTPPTEAPLESDAAVPERGWLTTPNDVGGVHRVGVFFDGMNTYGTVVDVDDTPTANSVFVAGHVNGLRGTATYRGGAAGVYVDGTASGMFTATASLTANFDTGVDGMADSGDYTLSGWIDEFKDTSGTYLGADTAARPNDPVSGGDSDWFVLLTAADLTDGGTITTDGAITRTGGAAGSADGVQWTGDWNARLYGAGDTVEDAVAPAGVAGNFRAMTANFGGDGVGGNPPPAYKGVVGAFGAMKEE